MAKRMKLPNGVKVFIATAFDTAISVDSISNAAPPIIEADAHGLVANDYVLVESAWCELDGRAYKVGVTDVDTLTLLRADTSDTLVFSPGGGVPASLLPVAGWTELPCITDSSVTGGEAQYTEVACLQEQNSTNLPNGFSPMTVSYTVSDDDGSTAIPIIEAISKAQETSVILLRFPNGKEILQPGYVSITPVPTLTRGEVMTRTISIALSDTTTYPAP